MQKEGTPATTGKKHILIFIEELKPAATQAATAEKAGLRSVGIPVEALKQFKSLAKGKMEELMGVLAGKLKNNQWEVEKILIPKQKGEEDRCWILEEGYAAVANYMQASQSVQIGWIHTHPGYSAFLSSIDLHTTWAEQKRLLEYLAIVYSGLQKAFKYFRVNPEHGAEIDACQVLGFHSDHPPEAYAKAKNLVQLKGNRQINYLLHLEESKIPAVEATKEKALASKDPSKSAPL